MGAQASKLLIDAAGAGDYRKVVKMIENGVSANSQDLSGVTPLHSASLNGRIEVVQYLLEKGADVRWRTKHGETPLHFAALHGNTKVCESLLEHRAELAGDSRGNSPLHFAAQGGHGEALRIMLNHSIGSGSPNKMGRTPLHSAAEKGSVECVALLILKSGDKEFLILKDALNKTASELARQSPLGSPECCTLLQLSEALLDIDGNESKSENENEKRFATIDHSIGGASALLSSSSESTNDSFISLWAASILERVALNSAAVSRFMMSDRAISFIVRALDSQPYISKGLTPGISLENTPKHLLGALVAIGTAGDDSIRGKILSEIDSKAMVRLSMSKCPSISENARKLLSLLGQSASDLCIESMRSSEILVKVRRRAGGQAHKRAFKLSKKWLEWESEKKKAEDSRISLESIVEVREGRRTPSFQPVKKVGNVPIDDDCCFSVIGPQGEKQSIDIICSTPLQRDIWVLGLRSSVELAKEGKTPFVVSEASKSLSQLSDCVVILSDHRANMDRRLDEQTRQARILIAADRQDEAKLCLRTAHLLRGELKRISTLVHNLEKSRIALESACIARAVIETNEETASALRAMNKEVGGVEGVESVVDEVDSLLEEAKEIGNVLNRQTADVDIDEAELEAELNDLANEQEKETQVLTETLRIKRGRGHQFQRERASSVPHILGSGSTRGGGGDMVPSSPLASSGPVATPTSTGSTTTGEVQDVQVVPAKPNPKLKPSTSTPSSTPSPAQKKQSQAHEAVRVKVKIKPGDVFGSTGSSAVQMQRRATLASLQLNANNNASIPGEAEAEASPQATQAEAGQRLSKSKSASTSVFEPEAGDPDPHPDPDSEKKAKVKVKRKKKQVALPS